MYRTSEACWLTFAPNWSYPVQIFVLCWDQSCILSQFYLFIYLFGIFFGNFSNIKMTSIYSVFLDIIWRKMNCRKFPQFFEIFEVFLKILGEVFDFWLFFWICSVFSKFWPNLPQKWSQFFEIELSIFEKCQKRLIILFITVSVFLIFPYCIMIAYNTMVRYHDFRH